MMFYTVIIKQKDEPLFIELEDDSFVTTTDSGKMFLFQDVDIAIDVAKMFTDKYSGITAHVITVEIEFNEVSWFES